MNWEIINSESRKLTNNLRKLKLTISTAESCTGGMIASAIVHNSGSSEIFNKGFITYSNKSKVKELMVKQLILDKYGAVSKECSLAMVNGLFRRTDAEIGISITGIAGPTGGTIDKPAGLVWISYGNKTKLNPIKFIFEGDRLKVRLNTTYNALKCTNEFLKISYL